MIRKAQVLAAKYGHPDNVYGRGSSGASGSGSGSGRRR